MASLGRESAEAAIGRVLRDHWDGAAGGSDSSSLPIETFAHDVYNLLVRGASDVQVERHLRAIERDDLHQPELGAQDLELVLRSLRSIEKSI
jgi:hypothetical protein